MRLRVLHTIRYSYPAPAENSHNELRLMPLSDSDQTCLDFRLSTLPPARLFAYDTPSGRVHHFALRAPHDELTIAAESLVVTRRSHPFAGLQRESDKIEFYSRQSVRQRYYEYLAPTQRVPLDPETDRIAAIARRQAGEDAASFLIALTRLLYRVFAYAPNGPNLHPSIRQVLINRQSVCQDFAHLMLAVCRRQGIPSRYISGYLYTGEPDQSDASQDDTQRDPSEDSASNSALPSKSLVSGSDMHAWVECLLPDGRWCGFDPINNLVANDYYIKVHYGRDYGDVLPMRGVYRGPVAQTLDVSIQVRKE